MKCPKCGYLAYESSGRCRNCGYDFSLTPEPGLSEISLQLAEEPMGPLPDLQILDRLQVETRKPLEALDLDRLIGVPGPPPDLPLFADRGRGDSPLITAAPPPRAPLAVRRSTPEVPRLRPRATRIEVPELKFDTDAAPAAVSVSPRLVKAPAVQVAARADLDAPAGVIRRVAAGAIDLVILLGINAIVVYFTLRLCGLTFGDLSILPRSPLLIFLLMLDAGYLAAFAAVGGQTIGKMAFGLRVVSDDRQPLDIGAATVRALGSIASFVPLGLGFVPAFLGEDHRAIHDRLTGTRVVHNTRP